MDKAFQDKMKVTLLEMKEQVLHNLMSENEDFKAAVEDLGVKDLADIASNDIDVRTLEALSSQDTLRLNKVESALIRLENGKYGVCARCSKKISNDRLEAIPYAVLCIDCKSASEKNKK
jgi:RNA polymerase-binding protein DksA